MSSSPDSEFEMPECRLIRPATPYDGKQGFSYLEGISAQSAGSTGIAMMLLTVPPGGRARAHMHDAHETAIFVLSGEVETFVFSAGGEMYVSLASDHTDRKLETIGVALSKQICAKPIARNAWRFADVAGHWDEMIIRAFIEEGGARVLYQEGPLAALRPPLELIAGFTGGARLLPEGVGMICGTVGAIGGIRPSPSFSMELFDPVLGRTIRHAYRTEVLPEVA